MRHSPKHGMNGLSDTTMQDNCIMTMQDNCISREQSLLWRTGQPSSAQNVSICMSLISYISIKSMPLCWMCYLSHPSQQEVWALIPRTGPMLCLDALKPKLGSHKGTEPATSPYKWYNMSWDAQESDEHIISVISVSTQPLTLLANLRL